MSLRTRLLIAVGAIALVALVAADVATYSSLRSFLFSRMDERLATTEGPVAHQFAAPPPRPDSDSGERPEDDRQEALATIAPGAFVQLRDAAGKPVAGQGQPAVVAGGRTYAPRIPATIAGLRPPTGTEHDPRLVPVFFTASARQSSGPRFRVSAALLPDGRQLIMALPLTSTQATLDRLATIQAAVTGGALLAAVLLGWWLVRVGLRPLRTVEGTAEEIAAGSLDRRVPGENERTEVGRLARALNVMLGRIETAFAERDATEAELRASEQRLRRFVADASHELRTPLAAVSAYGELLARGAVEAEEDVHRVLVGMRAEAARMAAMVEDLLALARLDEGRPLARDSVELVGLVAECVQTSEAVGPGWPVRLEASRPVEVVGDRERLRQVFVNLLANVRQHTPIGTCAWVRLAKADGEAIVEVEDDGPGLSKEQAAHAFERFYRADPSRSRLHGGAGLGLAIVAAVVEAHGGSVAASPRRPHGARFTVRLRLAPEESDLSAGAVKAGVPEREA